MRIDISMNGDELRADVSGVKVISPYSYECGEYRVDISYKTSLLYINGENVCSYYGGCSEELYRGMMKDYNIPSEIAESMAEWMSKKLEK